MKIFEIFLLTLLCVLVLIGSAFAYPVFAPEGHKLKVHWAVVQSKEGKMDEISAIGGVFLMFGYYAIIKSLKFRE